MCAQNHREKRTKKGEGVLYLKEKNTLKHFSKRSYWQCFFHFWVNSVVLSCIFLVLADNWPNIRHMQQTAQLQGSLMGVDISSSIKHQW